MTEYSRFRAFVFGIFEFSLPACELRKQGIRLKLDPQARGLLALLLTRRGQLVSYDEIQRKIWGDTAVDYSQGIRRCLAQLRQALGDQAAKPIYIRTERNRGCCFIAPVQVILQEPAQAKALADELPKPDWASWASRLGAVAGAVLLASLLAVTLGARAYGCAIAVFWVGALFILAAYRQMPDTALSRAGVSLYLVAAMSFTAAGSSMPPLMANVVNMSALPPASVFPFVMGLKYIPLPILVLACWTFIGSSRLEITPFARKAYWIGGIFMLGVTATSLAVASSDYRIWQARLPSRWVLAGGYAVVVAINVSIWYLGSHSLAESATRAGKLLLLCLLGYLPIAILAFFVDGEYNRINQYYLDVRWPEAYVAAHPDVAAHWNESAPEQVRTELGSDLVSRLKDPDFQQALRTRRFYKQHLDESFQLVHRAVLFGYQRTLPNGVVVFETIRFPKPLADALQFEPVGTN